MGEVAIQSREGYSPGGRKQLVPGAHGTEKKKRHQTSRSTKWPCYLDSQTDRLRFQAFSARGAFARGLPPSSGWNSLNSGEAQISS